MKRLGGRLFRVSEGRYNIWDAAPSLQTRDGEKDKSINLGRMKRDKQSCMTLDVRKGSQWAKSAISQPDNGCYGRNANRQTARSYIVIYSNSICAVLR